MAAPVELEEFGVWKQFSELTAPLNRDDHVRCPVEDQRRNVDLPRVDIRHSLVAPDFDDAWAPPPARPVMSRIQTSAYRLRSRTTRTFRRGRNT